MTHYRSAVAAIALTLTVAWGAQAQSNFGAGTPETRYFRTEPVVSAGRRGPQVEGYVYNLYDYHATRVLLSIDALDASGRLIETRHAFLPFDVPPRGRLFFETPVPSGTASARVSVESFDWKGTGGGGGGGGGGGM